jgi:two-component system, NtrC family, response regulator GlrR
LCGRAIHALSARSKGPFVPLNCGAIPVDLLENELFGHQAGAYTGAGAATQGLVREADGGTLFLDEIDSLPVPAQVKLLRFLQDKQFRSLGSSKTSQADLRIIAACNGNLEEAVRAGRFRKDLYYRLNVTRLTLPPLRERMEDVPALARHFLSKYATLFSRPARELSNGAMQRLMDYAWPGNVRELEHVIECSVVHSETAVVSASVIPLPSIERDSIEDSFRALKARAVADFERSYIARALKANEGNISRAARAAKKNRRAFWELLRKHRIELTPGSNRSSDG